MNKQDQAELAKLVDKYSDGDGIHPTAVPGLGCIKMSAPSMKMPGVYAPSLCVIVQGSKDVLLNEEIYTYSPSQFLAISVDLPILGQVTKASANEPYLCLQIDLDPKLMSELLTQSIDHPMTGGDTGRGLFVGQMDASLIDSVLRLTRLLDTPKDIPLLAPMILREIHYRLLTGEHAASVMQMAVTGSNMQRIADVIKKMKAEIARPMRVETLAEMARMSESSFHVHFKAITAMSPLQYHKRLRLTEARHIMISEHTDATSTAYRVGYESPSQFSREYSRMFGAPPGRDMEAIRSNLSQTG